MELDYMESELLQTWPWQIATWPICIALSAWILSLRHIASVRIDGSPYRAGPAVYVVWHRYSMLAVALLPPLLQPLVTLGNTAAHVRALRYTVRLTGMGVIPGSASQGAHDALAQLAQELWNGASVMVAVDGPRGPVYQAKPGCVRLAQAAGVPIVPVALGGRGFSHVRNWDRMLLPWPVNCFAVRFGEAIHPSDDMRTTLDRVDRQLHGLCASIGMEG